jgi:N,N-dimethylformamidase
MMVNTMRVVGYSDPISVRPGETIRFMVSSEAPTYRVDMVRLIHGDDNPRGPGFKEEVVPTPVAGEYPGRMQALRLGSYVTVPDSPLLRLSGSFTLQAWIYPTIPGKGVQGLLTKWSAGDGAGYGLFVDEHGALGLWLGDGRGLVDRASSQAPMRAGQWYFVAGVFDSEGRRIDVYQQPVTFWPRDETSATTTCSTEVDSPGATDAPFLMAGYWDQDGSAEPVVGGHFNGKIDSPRVFSRALSEWEIAALRSDKPTGQFGEAVVAEWDLARGCASARVADASSHGLDGEAVSMPARAVTGHSFTGTETRFDRRPSEYGAMYFHDDDLEDAGWDVDFELTVPLSLRSGVYAARLTVGDQEGEEDYVPFFVRPAKAGPKCPILFLAPTATYIAYANSQMVGDPGSRAIVSERVGKEIIFPAQPQDRYIVEHGLLSLYDRHSDGSAVFYSSRLRPVVSMRPKYVWPRTVTSDRGDTHPHNLSADLHLLDWMEARGYDFDVTTDEDLHFDGVEALQPYRVVVTGSHPEYWSAQMLDAIEEYLANGGRLMYLGGNGFYWVTSFDSARPHVIEVRRWHGTESSEAPPGEYHHSTTGELGGLWRFRGRPPQRLVGVGFTALGPDMGRPYQRAPGSFDQRAAFIFDGLDADEPIGDFGLVASAAAAFELDRADATLGTPHHALVLAEATGFSDGFQHAVEEVLGSDSKQGGTVNPLVRSELVYFEAPKGGGVFSVGSIAWCGSLSHNSYENNVSRITDNVLKAFSSEHRLPSA